MHSNIVDFKFNIEGTEIPINHEYWIYARLCQIIPKIKLTKEFGIHSINGMYDTDNDKIIIVDNSRLSIRTNIKNITEVINLVDTDVNIHGYKFRIKNIKEIEPIKPFPNLYSKAITINNVLNKKDFVNVICQYLAKLSITSGDIYFQDKLNKGITCDLDNVKIDTLIMHGNKIVGFPLYARNLSDEDSIKLQEYGLGGRRKQGRGIFIYEK